MDGQKNLEVVLESIDRIIVPVIIIVAGIVLYYLYKWQYLQQLIELIVALGFYSCGLVVAYWLRHRKKKRLVEENGSQDIQITINYFSLFWHDCLIFCTPAVIILFIYWIKGAVGWTDVGVSAICFIGLYLSKLVYKR